MMGMRKFAIVVLTVMACLPFIALINIPVYATTMANNTATSTLSAHNVSGVGVVGAPNYVGCVTAISDTMYGMGIRFAAVAIPQGATINSAYLAVTSSGNYAHGTVNSIIRGEDADSAAVFAGTFVDWEGRTRTSAFTTWDGIGSWILASEYVSVDISTVITEIVNRPGWASGNNMVIFWDDRMARGSQGSDIIRGCTSYKLVVDYTLGLSVVAPIIVTNPASNIGSSTALLNAYINSDGNDANGVYFRVGYDTISHSGTFAGYGTITPWSTSRYMTGETVSEALTGLSPSTAYFFNSQGQNSFGVSSGTEVEFVTPALVATLAPSSLTILPTSSSMSLGWVKPTGFSQCSVYYSVGSIPTSNITGTLLYSGSNIDYTQSGLTPGTTYGYRIYGREGTTWSTSTTGMMTTSGTATSAGLPSPDTPWNWFLKTDYTKQSGTFIYPIVNNLADSFKMPRNTAWVTWALALAIFFGFIAWSASRSMVATVVGVCGGIILGSAQGLLPMIMILPTLVVGISIISVRERI